MARTSTKQQEILQYLTDFTARHGYAPSIREICQAVGLRSTASVHYHMTELARQGRIEWDAGKKRAVTLHTPRQSGIPILGVVTAGQPILAQQNIDNYFPVPAEFVPKGESFILKVKGDSMMNVGIFNGDQIFVQCCNTARNGDIVVALVDDSATVKTFYKENGYIRLQPENDSMEPIIVDDCQILGKVFGVFRIF